MIRVGAACTRSALVAVGAATAVHLAECSGSSGARATDAGSGDGSGGSYGGGAGASSGATSGGSGASGGSGSGGPSGSSGSSSGSAPEDASGGGSGYGDTLLVGGRAAMAGLTVIGSNLYWVEARTGIFTVPVTGGTATPVYSNPDIDGALGSDGTSLYFGITSGSGSEVDVIAPDGTGDRALFSGDDSLPATSNAGPQIFVVGGTVYLDGNTNILTVSTSGGTPGTLLTSTGSVQALLWADASGVYYEDYSGNVYWVPLSGGTGSVIYTSPASGPEVMPGGLAVVGSAAYFLAQGSGPQTAQLMTSTAGATATPVATYPMENAAGAGLMPDGSGGLIELVGGDAPGIYAASASTGTQAPIDVNTNSIGILDLSGVLHALDATNVYYASVSAGTYTLWAHARY